MRRSQVPSLKKQRLTNSTTTNDSRSNQPSNQPSNQQLNSRSTINRSITDKPTSSPLNESSPFTKQQSKFQVFSAVFGTYKPGKKRKEWTDDAILGKRSPF